MSGAEERFFYEWNESIIPCHSPLEIHDETLRDGLQTLSITHPDHIQSLQLVAQMDKIGVNSVDIGFPGSGSVAKQLITNILKGVVQSQLKIKPCCAGRTTEDDVSAVIDVCQKGGGAIEAMLFLGSSPVRQYLEQWTITNLESKIRRSVSLAVENGLSVCFVTEDTTRSKPQDIERLYLTAIEAGANRICICDTAGHAIPGGVFKLVQFVKKMLKQRGLNHVLVDFHGHMDRGLGLWNSLVAFMAGANRIHGCAIGLGERSGNVPIDQLLVNLNLLGWMATDLTSIKGYISLASKIFGVPIPKTYPIFGEDVFTTSTGVHAAAIMKAFQIDREDLADRIYSSIPANLVGRKQQIRIGPLSGKACVINWLEQRRLPKCQKAINSILSLAKKSNSFLNDKEISECFFKATSSRGFI